MRRFGAMSKPSTASRGVEKWIASLEATRASPFPTQAVEKGQTIPDTSGPISGESSLKSNHDSASLKTWQDIFHLDLDQYGETFADWVTRLKRDSLRRQKLALRISDNGSSFWATPTSRDHKDGASPSEKVATNSLLGRQAPRTPMPGQQSSNESLTLNPRFVEWLMGFPIGWTDLQPLETASYQQWQQQHGDNLERRRLVEG